MGSFQSKIYSQTALFQLSMMALIFLPAWSLNYWQAWAYLIVFFGWVYFIDFYFLKHDRALLERRLKAGAKDEKEKSQKIIQSIASLCFIALFVVSGLDHHFHWSYMPNYLNVVGAAGVFFGFLIIFFVFKENSFTSGVIEIDQEQKVIDTGPYAHVRHPMYTGGILMVIATAFTLGSYWALIPSLFLTIAIVVRLLDEEKFLSQKLNGYPEYLRKVRYRLVPGFW